ncbi:MAG: DEAD/DEAH box helicase [Nanoarchaeota archaeon]|nr:DEAD/DEAH box helicase [Nanoarchaeota archaeon]
MQGKDVIGRSSTGSGKTLAFACAIIQNMQAGPGVKAVVLTPTRELAEQVSEALKEFSKYKSLYVTAIYGGVSINPQFAKLKKADVVVATPGRFLDHMERGTIDLSNVQIFVLDEADRMVDMGFIDDVDKIISVCPKKRQTLLFSATLSSDIERIKNKYMSNPESISAKPYVDPSKLKQIYYDVRDNIKFSLLVHLLSKEHGGLVIIFCNTRRQADFISKNLRANNLDAIAIHGGFSQAKRSANMDKFQSKNTKVLVCTDVAARGLDIPDVSHIYNYDIPNDSKEYIHRIGRTARAGKEGIIINILSSRDHNNFYSIQKAYSTISIEKIDVPELKNVVIKKETTEKRHRPSNRFNNHRRGNYSRKPSNNSTNNYARWNIDN